ncbi:PEP-CTERM sorting domain-containing protein [Singulisphaera rosea]
MRASSLLFVVASIALVGGTPALASPLTYAFTGTLQAPVNGSTQFSGSFTFDADPAVVNAPSGASTNPSQVVENGSEVSMTVDAGGQTFHFANDADPLSNVSFNAGLTHNSIMDPSSTQQDEASMSASDGTNSVGLSFYSPVVDLHNLRNLPLILNTGSFFIGNLAVGGQTFGQIEGTFSSIEPVNTPEPGSLALFAGIGIAAVAYRRNRRS